MQILQVTELQTQHCCKDPVFYYLWYSRMYTAL